MQFLTVREPQRMNYVPRASLWIGAQNSRGFEYEVTPAPTAEAINVFLGDAPRYSRIPQQLLSQVEVGARYGVKQAQEQGIRLCCIHFAFLTLDLFANSPTQFQVRIRVADCVRYHLLQATEPIPPLRGDWLTSDVIAPARGIHANAAFDALPALYDALLEAGCDHLLVMEHLQTCPDHSPSCWVAEMIVDQAAARG